MMRKGLDATIAAPTLQRKPYPSYKPSGIEWLGEIPSQWQMMRLRFCAKINPAKSEVSLLPRDTTVSFIPMEMLSVGSISLEYTKTLEECSSGYTYFRNSDVIVAKITPCFENKKGAIAEGLKNEIGFGTTELHVLRANPDLNPKFLFYLTASHSFREIGTGAMYGAGGQKRVPDDFIRDFRHPIPPLPEQRAIAAFLDRETARIDALIEKKQRQIELLQEKRTALISHAVTKGLDPNVKMKSSGIEWLGQIPGHWDARRLKYVSSCNDEVLSETTDPDFELVYVDIGSVDQNAGILIKEQMHFESAPSRARRKVRHGDVVVSTVRTYLRAIAPITHPEPNLIVSTGFAVIRPKDGLLHSFAAHALRARYFVDAVVARSAGVSYPAINAGDLIALPIALPPQDEQRAIAAFLDRETARIDSLIGKIEKSIELLREYRSALISAAVTGKIDVREEIGIS